MTQQIKNSSTWTQQPVILLWVCSDPDVADADDSNKSKVTQCESTAAGRCVALLSHTSESESQP